MISFTSRISFLRNSHNHYTGRDALKYVFWRIILDIKSYFKETLSLNREMVVYKRNIISATCIL